MDKSKKAEEFARASIEAIRKIAMEKKEMNIENLAEEFIKNSSLFSSEAVDLDSYENESDYPPEYLEIVEKLEHVERQKNAFFRDYEELNEKRGKEKEFYNRALLFFSELSKSGMGDQAASLINNFRTTLKKGSGFGILEEEFMKLKNQTMKMELENTEKEEDKKTFLKKFKLSQALGSKAKGYEYGELLRESYREIIEKLSLAVDEASLKILVELVQELKKAGTPDDFFVLRSRLLGILNSYLISVDDDREEAAAFIKEIGKKLMEVEDQILNSYSEDSERLLNSNSEFTSLLEDHLDDLNKNVSMSQTLEEVKSAVVSKLNTIKIAIHRKNAHDKKYQEEVNLNLTKMKQKLDLYKREMAKAEIKNKKMEKDLLLDPLTGAYNRRAYNKRVKEEVERFFRYGTEFSMILFDIDHFKKINDTYGHDIGDKCLYEIIHKVSPLLRESDFLSRYGGEEFAILLPETGISGAENAAEKIRKTVEEISFVYKKEEIKITISLGVGQINKSDGGYDSLFSRLDKAMYKAKNTGRNKVVVSKI